MKPNPKSHPPSPKTPLRSPLLLLIIITLILITAIASFQLYFWNRIFPGIHIASINVSGLTKQQAKEKLTQELTLKTNQTLKLSYKQNQYELPLSSLNLEPSPAIDTAFEYGRQRFYLPFSTSFIFKPLNILLVLQSNSTLNRQIDTIDQSISQPPIEAQIKVDSSNTITVTPSQTGLELDRNRLLNQISTFINTNTPPPSDLPTAITYPKLSYTGALNIKNTLDKIKLTPLKLVYEDQQWLIDLNTLLSWLDLTGSKSNLASINLGNSSFILEHLKIDQTDYSNTRLTLNRDKIYVYFQSISPEINQDVQEPLFQFDGQKVIEFKPPVIGKKLNIPRSIADLETALQSENFSPLTLPVDIQEPKSKLSNELGIKELIGQGVSNFAHSIPNRIFNISLAASRINGVLIPPGETFSFVNTVGDISASSGYKQAYVIKSGRTVLDDGGGVCQVSTTVFRAALNSGLPIPERTAHAYRVEYYEQGFPPGLDATVFSPSVDLKFRNDTPSHILIQTRVEGTTLYVDLYGTKDNRVVNLTKPVITSQTPPLPEIRQDDPTLPKGTVKQVDWPAWGAKVVFSRTVEKDGQVIINEKYNSNYRSWQAVYLVGTKEN